MHDYRATYKSREWNHTLWHRTTTAAATAESDWDFTAESDLPTSPREAAEEAATNINTNGEDSRSNRLLLGTV